MKVNPTEVRQEMCHPVLYLLAAPQMKKVLYEIISHLARLPAVKFSNARYIHVRSITSE